MKINPDGFSKEITVRIYEEADHWVSKAISEIILKEMWKVVSNKFPKTVQKKFRRNCCSNLQKKTSQSNYLINSRRWNPKKNTSNISKQYPNELQKNIALSKELP